MKRGDERLLFEYLFFYRDSPKFTFKTFQRNGAIDQFEIVPGINLGHQIKVYPWIQGSSFSIFLRKPPLDGKP